MVVENKREKVSNCLKKKKKYTDLQQFIADVGSS